MTDSTLTRNATAWFVRIALAVAFLSAVADRLGLWGPPGAANVAWGGWAPFLDYVALINPLVPAALIPALGWIATALEIGLALGLLAGWKLRWFALGSGPPARSQNGHSGADPRRRARRERRSPLELPWPWLKYGLDHDDWQGAMGAFRTRRRGACRRCPKPRLIRVKA